MTDFKQCYKLSDLRKILNKRASSLETIYGKSDKTIDTFYNTNQDNYWVLINQCRLYFQAKHLVVITPSKLFSIPFARIVGYDIIDVNGGQKTPLLTASTSVIKTDMGDMIKRAIIGGVTAGGVGAVVGAATAKKTITSELSKVDEYRNLIRINTNSTNLALIIKTDDIASPTLKIPFDSFKKKAEDMAASLNAIITHNVNSNDNDDTKVLIEKAKIVSYGSKLGLEPTDPFKKQEEEYHRQMQEERESAARKEKLEKIGVFITLALIIATILFAILAK